MAIRAKTKRRLFILIGSVATVIALGATIYTVRMAQIREDVIQAREVGMVAMDEGDYHTAMHQLGRYLQHHTSDAEATYHYAQARLRVEEPDGRHLVHGARSLRRALELDPDRHEVRRQLLEVYGRIGFSNEAIDLARLMLADDPDDAEALRTKMEAMVRLRMYDRIDTLAEESLEQDEHGEYIRSEGIVTEVLRGRAMASYQQSRYAEALPIAELFNERRPEDYEMQRLTVELLHELNRSSQAQRAHVRRLREAYPDHPGFAALEARTLRRFGDMSAARAAMADAASADLSEMDEVAVMDVLNELDRQQMFAETLDAMQRVAPQMDGLMFRRVMAQRLALSQQWDALLKHFEPLEATANRADSVVLAFLAMTRFELGEPEKAKALVEELRSRVNDSTAIEWSSVLSAVYGMEQPSPRELIEVIRRSDEGGERNPFYQHWLARAYQQVGELDLAIAAWQRAAQAAPSWNLPLLEAAQVLAQTGRSREAVGVAQLALRRAPNDIRAALVLAESIEMQWDSLTSQQTADLRRLLSQIQAAIPFEPRSLSLQVRVLTASGELEAARERVAAALEADANLPSAVMVQLAEAMASADAPELERQLLDRMDLAEGSTSNAARIQQVQAMVEAGQGGQALAVINQQVDTTEGDEKRSWRLLKARLLDQLGDARALAAWVELVDDYPQDAGVHQRVLSSNLAWQDRELMDKVIDRVRSMAGDEALSWRVARARWLMGAPEGERSDSDVADLLQYVIDASAQHVQARLLMAHHHEQTGNASAAINQMTRVAQLHPERADVRLQLARLLQARGDETQARMHMEAVHQLGGQMQPERRLQAASMLVGQGELDRAIALLEPYHGTSVQHDMTLAQLYAQAGRVNEAGQMYDRLLQQPTQAVVEQATQFFSATGQQDRAASAIGHLDDLELAPGVADLIRGGHYAAVGETSAAREAYRRAVDASPDNALAWRRHISYTLTAGDVDEALAMLKQASETTQDTLLARLVSELDVLRAAAAHDVALPLLTTLLNSAANHEVAMQAVRAMASAATPSDALPTLQTLADEHESLVALQATAYRLHMVDGSHEQAIELAQRMMRLMPGSAEPAWMMAEALSAAGDWEQAMEIAQEASARGGVAMADADGFIAEAQLHMGDSAAALRQIEPYLDEAKADPEANAPLIVRAARAKLQLGEVERAERMLDPLLEKSSQWRGLWLQLAVLVLEDDATATRWLDRLNEVVANDARDERFQLAQGYWTLLDRTQSGEHREAVRRTLMPLTELDPPMAEAVMGLAVLEDAAGNRDLAEQGYREALAIERNLPIAANNLAVILYQRGESLDEAVTLARSAVSAAPQHAPFRHTLAQALQTRGDHAEAMENMQQAVEFDGGNVRWHVALAKLLLSQDQHDAAGEVLANIDDQFPETDGLPDEVREDLDAARSQWQEQRRSTDAQ
ncbi:tetratricopeptide repeat protein [Phycisphaerales bacterium AB-hyl4]|uniref:Tetratricopeptide repeat protein n=1 Tax=Natronomicrosphaera hydrolytica TaxID=3242702 RepID=A0ABV4U3S9_9BACT